MLRKALLVVTCLAFPFAARAGPITTGGLIDEMLDVRRLADFPDPAFKTIQFSSYDRRSGVPGGKEWFANSDGFGEEPIPNFERVIRAPEGKNPGEYLICDVAGPGAIVRLWTAQITGGLRVYLDDAQKPLYDGPAEDFLLHPYNSFLKGTGLSAEALTGSLYQRNASYAPIPFAARCRIVWIGNHRETHFYQVQVRSYAKPAAVVSFSPQDIEDNADRIRRVAAVLSGASGQWSARSTMAAKPIAATLAPHAAAPALDVAGPGAIERLTLKVAAPRLDEALRQTLLYIQCDGDPWGQVQAPVGDFFRAGPGINPYDSLPFTVAPDGTMTCRFAMPFRESFRIVFDNRSDQEVTVTGSALPAEYIWNDATSMYFYARWRADHDRVCSGGETMGAVDMPFLIARGKGVYVGTAIMLLNPNCVPTSWGNWWGEGDEKIFVDDDVQPSIFGTGSEDYFNYAWSTSDLFAFPYCGQARDDGPANRGFVCNYRWHVLDPLPFAQNIAFYMELFGHERTEGFSYGRIGYYYARPGAVDDHVPLTDAQARIPELPPTWGPAARFGAEHWEFRSCEDLASTEGATTFERGGLWQGGQVLVWTPAKAGERVTLSFPTARPGRYALLLACMFRPGAGAFHAELDGHGLAFDGKKTLSLATPYALQSRVAGAKPAQLSAGTHRLVLIATEPGKPIGLDFFASCAL